jgi:DNA end-binding protein Ku
LIEPQEMDIPHDVNVGEKELEMATELVKRLSGQWEPSKYKDDYRSSLMKVIEEKIKHGGRTPAGAEPTRRAATNMIDLADVLKQSLESASKGSGEHKSRGGKKQKRAMKKAA